MDYPKTYRCPIAQQIVHKIVYENQNKAEFIQYVHAQIQEMKDKKGTHKYFAVHTDRSFTQIGFDDLFIIEIAQCFRDFPNLAQFRISVEEKQYVNLESGFILINPDDEVKEALSSILTSYTVHPIMYDFLRDYTALIMHGINVNTGIRNKKDSFQIYDPQAAFITKAAPYISSVTLDDAIKQIKFECYETIAAIDTIEVPNYPKLIYENQGKSNTEIIQEYIKYLPYFVSRPALVALSVLRAISKAGTLYDIRSRIFEKKEFYLKANDIVKNGGLLFQEIMKQHKLLRNVEDHPYESLLFINDLLKQKRDIQKVKPDFRNSNHLKNYKQSCLAVINATQNHVPEKTDDLSVASMTNPFSAKLTELHINGELRDFLNVVYSDLVSSGKIHPGKEFEDVINQLESPLLMVAIESTSKLSDKNERNAQYQKIYDILLNS
ncbi:hypothetical protein TVAG_147370 [Trichomonas vaginalis G3]|uniref:Uncharacterized protein n=1 Tax=Trichomonas vaginalis (strain ATCC PRA-98 / G3) TaxID=412133 RepID=A2G7S1_TRIV3|nr:hypothetical protein TVAGG3_0322120 [Trichomonas vaginalis G3]EAX86795.1 hypothetical protein TVAG_147370 [Trichomonas vaginalis G3]KAI5529374.1 hypothetical protein TVAGG3_0322120 [Trichomonas vaginalis G3]|eukprot:XP_001299725.1 hypothetical protein [Trichomonas vaginalis G3]